MIIGITGKAHSGKDTVAEYLKNHLKNSEIYSFAFPIKKMAMDIFGFTKEQCYDQNKKEEMDDFWNITPRKFLQLVGTDLFREHFDKDVWVKCAEVYVKRNPETIFIIPDVRFNNEAEFIKRNEGILISIVRNFTGISDDAKEHISEKGVDEKYLDWGINNFGTKQELFDGINDIIERENLK